MGCPTHGACDPPTIHEYTKMMVGTRAAARARSTSARWLHRSGSTAPGGISRMVCHCFAMLRDSPISEISTKLTFPWQHSESWKTRTWTKRRSGEQRSNSSLYTSECESLHRELAADHSTTAATSAVVHCCRRKRARSVRLLHTSCIDVNHPSRV